MSDGVGAAVIFSLTLHVVGCNMGPVGNLPYLSGYNKCAGRILSDEFLKVACLYHENDEYIHPFIH